MKKVFKCFSLLSISAFLLALFFAKPVSANYDNSKNGVSITAYAVDQEEGDKKLGLKISITYQRGIDKDTAQYKICRKPEGAIIAAPTDCTDVVVDWTNFITEGNYSDYISKENASKADKNTTKKTFEVEVDSFLLKSENRESEYVIFVQTFFCAVREGEAGSYGSCQYWHNSKNDANGQFAKKEFKVGDVLNKTISTEIENEGLNDMMEKISAVVYDTVMPIIYGVLGLFLVVKGAILGVQIVKAADEPQVRQEKIGSLKWLIIGCAIAFLAAGVVHAVMGFFSGAFSGK